jgi:hypothetical protein
MIASAKYLLAFLILIWIGVFSLTKINSDIISEIISNRETIEILRMDREFWRRNSGNIASVVDKQKSLYHEIESLKLGEVALNDNIKRLFDESGVYDLVIEMDSKSIQGDSVPVSVSFKGTPESGEQALNRVQKEFPYLSYREIGFLRESDTNVFKYDAVVNYRYKLVTKQSGQ